MNLQHHKSPGSPKLSLSAPLHSDVAIENLFMFGKSREDASGGEIGDRFSIWNINGSWVPVGEM